MADSLRAAGNRYRGGNGVRAAGVAFTVVVVGVFGVASTGCGKVQAKTPGPLPAVPLVTPEPPARLHIPVSAESAAAAPVKPEPEPAPARPRPTASPPPPATPPVTPQAEAAPPPIPPAAGQAEFEARARDKLASAERDLGRVAVSSLPTAARDQYDSAVRFVRMAKDAMTARNFVYAAYCADKAATLASLLVKRVQTLVRVPATDTSF